MPKAKPDRVVVHRIEFQESEREMLSLMATSWSAEKLSKSVFNLTSDITTLVVLILLYEMITGKETGILDALANMTGDTLGYLITGWHDYRNSQEYSEEYHERATSVTGGLRNLFDQIIFALTGGPFRNFEENQNE